MQQVNKYCVNVLYTSDIVTLAAFSLHLAHTKNKYFYASRRNLGQCTMKRSKLLSLFVIHVSDISYHSEVCHLRCAIRGVPSEVCL